MNLSPEWRPRDHPLEPAAMVAQGEASRRLANKLLSLEDEILSELRGASGEDMLLLLGPESCLPWVDGALYLGRDPAAPSLLLPTNLEPNLPVSLLERAFQTKEPDLLPPLAIVPASRLILSAGGARPLFRAALQEWLEKHR